MDIGVCVASHVGDIDYVVRAEELGYSHAWLADSQMLWSDCYAALALVADRTSTINIGTGVSVSGSRPAPVTAASIATINALAPGRTFLGLGTGNTAMRIMGNKPQKIAEFDDYLETLKPLLRGEEASHSVGGQVRPTRGLSILMTKYRYMFPDSARNHWPWQANTAMARLCLYLRTLR